MKKLFFGILAFCGLLGFGLAGRVMANGALEGDEPAMMASPQLVVLAKVTVLTVHTNIPAAAVDFDSIALNGIAPTGIGVDSRGHLVAKFAISDLGLVAGEATLTLTGNDNAGNAFSVSDVVGVK